MKKCLLFLCSFCLSLSLQASDFRIINSELIYIPEAASPLRLKVTLTWDNAWRNDKNHDAAWLFARMVHRDGWYVPEGAFYCMKYEITQGQYVDFLNAISDQASYFRANFGGKHYYQNRGTISLEGDKYVAASPRRPLNYVSWDDGCAFSDWAGLRPMTELEFTKACRGPQEPLPHDYPWGSSTKAGVMRYVSTQTDELVMAPGFDESLLSDQNREAFAASIG